MGRRSDRLDPDGLYKFHLVRLKWVDWDYDQGGAYWGNSGGTSIYWAYDERGTEMDANVFIRARDREDAKAQILADAPKARFFR